MGTSDNNDINPSATVELDRRSLELTAVVNEGSIGGTPDYCSPDQWFATVNDNDKLVDGRTDIFSLGVIFNEMLTRRRAPPYDPNNPNLIRAEVSSPSKYNSLVPPKLDQCILKMTDLKPENRQQSVWELISEIETIRIVEPILYEITRCSAQRIFTLNIRFNN